MYYRYQKLAVIFIILFCFHSLFGEEKKEEEKKENRPVSIIKFIPGVSQVKSGKLVKGGILLVTFSAAIFGAISENKRGNDLYEKYLNSSNEEEVIELRRQTEKKFKNRNYYFAGIVGIWLIHLVDLKLFKDKKGGIKGEVDKKKINICFYYSF